MIVAGLSACLAVASPAAPATPTFPSDQAQVLPLRLAEFDQALDVTGETLQAREVNTRLTLPVEVEGAGPFRFVVDSGADRSAVGLRLSTMLGLRPEGCLRLHSMVGTTLVPAVHVDRLRFGSGMIENVSTPALPEAAIGADGMLGIDALAGRRIKLDFEARTIIVEDAKRRDSSQGVDARDIVVTARRQRGQLILAAASSSGIRLLAVIHTGAEVTVGNMQLRMRVLAGRKALESHPVELVGVTGERLSADLVTIPQLAIDGLILRNLPVAFVDAPPFALFGLADTPAMMLGTDVLRAFRRVSLDFRRRKVRFSIR